VDLEKDLTVRERDGVTVVRFNVEGLLGHEVELLSGRVRALIENGARKLVLDFKHVKFAGSAVLGMLLALSKHATAMGGKLILSHTEHIEALFKVSRSERMFTLAPDAKAAVEMFNAPPAD
jgi:anti-sigma B factor antagonist